MSKKKGGGFNPNKSKIPGAKAVASKAQENANKALNVTSMLEQGYRQLLTMTQRRLAAMEQAMANLIDSNTVLMREVGRMTNFDWKLLNIGHLELNLIKDFTAIFRGIQQFKDVDSPLLLFDEMNSLTQNKPVEKPFNFVLIFNEEEKEGLTLTQNTDGTIKFHGGLVEYTEEEDFTGFQVAPVIFKEWVLGQTSTEAAVMRDQISTADHAGVARWISNLDYQTFMLALAEEAELTKEKEDVKKEEVLPEPPDRMQIDPKDFETTGHPEGARIFGGDVGVEPAPEPSPDAVQ